MLFLDCTLERPEQNLALDEALLEECDGGGAEVLRIWKPRQKFVVVGYTQSVEQEVHVAVCLADGVPVLRRITGGGTVLHDHGSLCYALIMKSTHPEISTVGFANQWIMAKQLAAVKSALGDPPDTAVRVNGDSDITLNARKVSGNAQRRKVRAVLFHGTFLMQADYADMERYLRFPSKQPEYRADRKHTDFVTTLPVDIGALVSALRTVWQAIEAFPRDEIPLMRAEELVAEKYGVAEWNFRL